MGLVMYNESHKCERGTLCIFTQFWSFDLRKLCRKLGRAQSIFAAGFGLRFVCRFTFGEIYMGYYRRLTRVAESRV